MHRAKNGLVLVEFTQGWGSYSRGRTAGFPDKEAERIVKVLKVARYKGTEETKPAEAKPEDTVDEDDIDPIDGLMKKAEEEGKDWHDLHHATLRSVASQVSNAPILSKDDAVAAIEAELEKRNAGQ